MVVHAGTSTTYPISFCEAFYAGLDFVRQNPPPVRLPGSSLFTLPLDYRPDEEAVKRCKYWTGWKVRSEWQCFQHVQAEDLCPCRIGWYVDVHGWLMHGLVQHLRRSKPCLLIECYCLG
jgi:hypothetical protein